MSNPKGNIENLKSYQPKWKSGQTRTIRVPIALCEELLTIARKLDQGESRSVMPDLSSAIEQVLSDPTVTRNGKDRGAARRALNALLEVYQCKPPQAESRAL